MLPPSDGHVMLSTILVSVFIVTVGAIFTILCCLPKKSKKDDNESASLIVNEGNKERSYKVYDSISATDQPPTESPQDMGKDGAEEVPTKLDQETKNLKEQTNSNPPNPPLSTPPNAPEILYAPRSESPPKYSPRQTNSSEISLLDPDLAESDKDTETEENIEREIVNELSTKLFPCYPGCEKLSDLGSRLQKYWYLRTSEDQKTAMQFTVRVASQCPISFKAENMALLKKILVSLKHARLLTIVDVVCHEGFISIVQDFMESGSIRDQLFEVKPTLDWEKKYTDRSDVRFPTKEIAKCSRHVLEAVMMLYDLGFPSIGQIHCGNVFCKDGRYCLGGFENVLLGYRSSIYNQIREDGLLKVIDVIMFGRMIYEIATGILLQDDDQILLDNNYFTNVKDSNVRSFLQFIFSEQLLKKENPMKEIYSHSFVKKVKFTEINVCVQLSSDAKALLARISQMQTGEHEEKAFREYVIMEVAKKLKSKYYDVKPCKSIGCRQNKLWAMASSKTHGNGLISAIKIPYTCPVLVQSDIGAIKSILKRNENFLVFVQDVHHLKIDEDHWLVIFEEIFESGSLKDEVHGSSPWHQWKDKYSHNQGHPLPEDEIARIGSQLLNIALALGSMDGAESPFKLQFLHTGNIFKRSNCIAVGGLESLLIGLRPHDHMKFQDSIEFIDTMMFGHLIYELASGREMKTLIPTDEDYNFVSYESIKSVLKIIFEKRKMNLKEILHLEFFSLPHTIPLQLTIKDPTEKLLLEHVRKGKRRNQDKQLQRASLKMKAAQFRKIFKAKSS